MGQQVNYSNRHMKAGILLHPTVNLNVASCNMHMPQIQTVCRVLLHGVQVTRTCAAGILCWCVI